jgi:glycosyltransferase involved in cell wall biosynthesis
LPNVTGGLILHEEAVPEEDPQPLPEPGYFLYVGRLRIRKGVEVLLQAMAAIQERPARPRLLIAGSGEQEDSLRRKVAELGLASQVKFLGRCSAHKVRNLLSGALCLVVPSTYEGMPLVILEAMSEGVPVVASAVSGIPEVVLDGTTGWLVPAEDPERLAAALLAVQADPAGATVRGEAGRRRVREVYTPVAAATIWAETLSYGP